MLSRYDQLRRIAHRERRRGRSEQTLGTAEVLHEAYAERTVETYVAVGARLARHFHSTA